MKIFLFLFLLCTAVKVPAQETSHILTPASMQRDLSVLEKAWTSLHPGIYRYNTPAGIKRRFTLLRELCLQPKSEKKFYLLLAQLAESVKCGHTFLNPLNMDEATRKRIITDKVMPVFFRVVENKQMVVTHAVFTGSRLLPGDRIISINGIAAGRIIDSLLTVSRSDGRNADGKKLANINETPDEADAYSLFDIFLPLFFGINTEQFMLTVAHYSGITETIVVPGMQLSERKKIFEETYGSLPVAEKTWEYRLVSDSVAYMKFGTFAFWNSRFDPVKAVDSMFQQVNAMPKVKHLVVDIRDNEGGDNTGDYILSWLARKPIPCDKGPKRCYRYLAIADSLLPYLSTWDKSFKQPKDTARYFRDELGLWEPKDISEACEEIRPRKDGFRGKVYLMINAKNSSAGYEMARDFSRGNIGLTVGETTGGSQQGINGGEFFFLTLPASKIEIDLPLIYARYPGKPDKGIVPIISVPVTRQSIAEKKDNQLDAVMKLIHVSNNQKQNHIP